MPCNKTLGKFIHKQTELDYLYSSLKEGTFTLNTVAFLRSLSLNEFDTTLQLSKVKASL